MKFEVRIGEVARIIEIERDTEGHAHVRLDDGFSEVDAVEIGAGIYSIRIGGLVFEAHVLGGILPDDASVRCRGAEFRAIVRDPRAWLGGRNSLELTQGPQQVVAPMPGKVVRVLVAAGDMVEAGRGLVVVEAMKMQNEIRAPKGGLVKRLFVHEGQNVSTGEALAIIT